MTNRTAFVTGASRGIGRSCALALAAAGHRVAVGARTGDKLGEVAAEIRGKGGEAYAIAIDLASGESIKHAMTKTAEEFGRVDILVNNAAITKDGLAMRM